MFGCVGYIFLSIVELACVGYIEKKYLASAASGGMTSDATSPTPQTENIASDTESALNRDLFRVRTMSDDSRISKGKNEVVSEYPCLSKNRRPIQLRVNKIY